VPPPRGGGWLREPDRPEMCWLVVLSVVILPGVGKTPLPIINCLRAEVGAHSLTRDPVLAEAAERKAADIRRCGFRHDACGRVWTYHQPRGRALGEVLAYGYLSWRITLWAWTLSPTHLAVLLRSTFRRIGFAFLKTFYVIEVSS
jgi:uncharacterized protein YkwD